MPRRSRRALALPLAAAALSLSACGGHVDLAQAPIEVCSRVNLLTAKAEIESARRHASYFESVAQAVTVAEETYREGEWAQQRGECELSARRGLDAQAQARAAVALEGALSAKLDAAGARAKARADVAAALRAINAELSEKAARNLAAAEVLLSEAESEKNGEKSRRLASEASLRAVAAWKLFDITLSGHVDSEMAKAKIVLDEAEKAYAKAVAGGARTREPASLDQAELWIKVARFDVEENDPPEVAEFSLKALAILEQVEKRAAKP